MTRRHTWRFFSYWAQCEDCSWQVESKNGFGLAAQHHDRTGHNVGVSVEGHVNYVNDERNEELARFKEKQHKEAKR